MSELLKLPYLVDPHVHFRTPGHEFKEDFLTGSKAAIAGGVTMVGDMPNNKDLADRLVRIERKDRIASETSLCDTFFHLGTLGDEGQNFREVEPFVKALKVYMNRTTGQFVVNEYDNLNHIFRAWDFDKPILVHAEGDTLKPAIKLSEKYNRRLHVCHVSLADEVKQIRDAKNRRPEMITAEVTPHHLFKGRVWGAHPFNQMRPPLSSFGDMEILWDALRDGTIDIVATDHAPHTVKEKLSNNPPSGVTGLETMLPLLLMAERQGEISLERIIEATHTSPIRIFNLPQQPETFIEVDRGSDWQIRGENLQTKAQLTPFEGETVMDKVYRVTLRGKIVYEDGEFLSKPGSGKTLNFFS